MSARTLTRVSIVLLGLAAAPVWAQSDYEAIVKATELFQRYVELGHAFDPAIVDLYSDDAVIRNRRVFPTGEVREIEIPVAQYKQLIVQVMPMAKEAGDIDEYSRVTYQREGEGVRVRATRYTKLKDYSSPVSMLAMPDSSGNWRIVEEISESRP